MVRPLLAAPIFSAPVTYAVDGAPITVAAADVNGDSVVDLVTANQAGDIGPSLSALFADADGGFTPEDRTYLDPRLYLLHTMAAGDFNGDRVTDVAVAVDDLTTFPPRAAVLVLLNDGSGLFAGPVAYFLDGVFPQCLVTADVTGDGQLDLVVCHSATSGGGLVSVLRGIGDGRFVPRSSTAVGNLPSAAAVADLDSDGRIDVVVVDSERERIFALYGSDTLPSATLIGSVDSPRDLAVAVDPLGPLRRVLVTSAAGQLAILRQTMPRVFSPTTIPVSPAPSRLARGDVDADGLDDLVLLSEAPARANLWLGRPTGGFVFAESVSLGGGPSSLVLADFNSDHRLDLAVTSADTDRVAVSLNLTLATPPASRTATRTPTGRATPTATSTSRPPLGTPTPTRTPVPTATLIATGAGPGDANCDGRIDAPDVMALIKELFEPTCAGADVNGDGKVNAADVAALLILLEDL
jgi:hypothetical protein